MTSTYSTLLKALFEMNQKGAMKLGLETMQCMDRVLGFPSQCFSSIHIAGTNGKGSTAAKIAKALEISNPQLKIGLFTSPHICTFRERIKINGNLISESRVEKILRRIFSLSEEYVTSPTFFEITTLLAFCYFKEEGVDIAVIETGLGGRLDATNIITPLLSVITSIDYDHQSILGSTLDEIALEKAGIIKEGIPVVVGPKARLSVIHKQAVKKNAPYFFVENSSDDYDIENQTVAHRALEVLRMTYPFISISSSGIEKGLAALPLCRFERVIFEGKEIILDVGHNPDGLKALFRKIKIFYPTESIKVLVGMSKEKDVRASLSVVASFAAEIYITEALSPRAAPVSMLVQYLNELNFSDLSVNAVPSACLKMALSYMKKSGEILVVCGSFFIMQEIRQALHITEERDPCLLQESLQTAG